MDSVYAQDRRTAWECAENCDICWFLLTDTALEEIGDAVIAVRLRAHISSGHLETGGLHMMEEEKRRADATNKAVIAEVAVDLMNAFNHDKTDPSLMATHGHDTMTGYEFFIERSGAVIKVELTRDLD